MHFPLASSTRGTLLALGPAVWLGACGGEPAETGPQGADFLAILETGDQTAVGELTVNGETFSTWSGVAFERSGTFKIALINHPHANCEAGTWSAEWMLEDAPNGSYIGLDIRPEEASTPAELEEDAPLKEAVVTDWVREREGKSGGDALFWVDVDGHRFDPGAAPMVQGRVVSSKDPDVSFDISFAVPYCGTSDLSG